MVESLDYSNIVDMMLKNCSVLNEDSQSSYMHHSIERICRWFVQCDQRNYPEEGYKECLRVIRLRRGIPKYALSSICKNTTDTDDAVENAKTIFGGCYMVVKCVLLSEELLNSPDIKHGTGKYTYYTLPKELKSVYEESTLRFNIDGTAIVLAKSGITDYITTGGHYKMLEYGDM